MPKRNKKRTRTLRHRARLHNLIEQNRSGPADPNYQKGYAMRDWAFAPRFVEQVLSHGVLSTAHKDRRWREVVEGSVRYHAITVREVSAMVGVEILPIAVTMVVRGRPVTQYHAEFAENKNRFKDGDVM